MSDLTRALAAETLHDAAAAVAGHLDASGSSARVWLRHADGRTEHLAGPGGDPVAPVEVAAPSGATVLVDAADVTRAELTAAATILAATSGRLRAEEDATLARRRLADSERVGRMGSFDWEVSTDTNHWSDELFRIYGLEPGSMAPGFEQFIARIHPDDQNQIRGILEQAIATGSTFEMEERIVRPDGEIRILSSFGEVVTDTTGAPVRLIGLCRDVTEQRTAEADADAARHRVEEVELRRRQALQLNDTVVQGLVALLWHLDPDDAPEVRRLVEAAMTSAKRIMADLLRAAGDEFDPDALLRTSHAGPAPTVTGPADARVGAPTPRGDTAGLLRVVLADDAADLRMLLRRRFEKAPHLELVAEAEDGERAVELVERHRPDAVLLDLSMPVLDGLGAAKRIRASAPGTHIIVFSGYPAESVRDQALAAGADAYVEKTSDLGPLLASLAPAGEHLGSPRA
jgi:PAS domain S-box-containing protein